MIEWIVIGVWCVVMLAGIWWEVRVARKIPTNEKGKGLGMSRHTCHDR